jgi:hypothetical protein
MAIKVSSKKCFTASQKRSWQKLANYVTSHYPKDSDLHKAVRGTFKAIDDAAKKLGKAPKKNAKPKRRAIKRTTPKHRKVKRSTAKRSPAKRRGVKRAAPKRHTAKRRVIRRGKKTA